MVVALCVLALLAVSCSSVSTVDRIDSDSATSLGGVADDDPSVGGQESESAASTTDPAASDPTADTEPPVPGDEGEPADSDSDGSGTEESDEPLRSIDGVGWPLALNVTEPSPDDTPLPVDPQLRTGQLDNGLVWYARSNSSPGNSLSLRLAVDAGAVQQDNPESGLAHFVEHMLFNGTTKYPGNSLDTELSSLGVTFGPDLNAYTSADETVYQLDLQSNSSRTLDIGLGVMSEWAGAALMDPDEVAAEIGVVREEIRLGNEVVTAPIDALFDQAYTDNTQYELVTPGGEIELINQITPEDARRYYDRWYRPDNMAVVAVGDYSLDTLERAIVDNLSDLAPRGDAPTWQRQEVALIEEPFVEVLELVEGGRSFISIDWAMPTWDSSTVGGERLWFLELLLTIMMENRLQDRVDVGEYQLFDPFVTRFDWNRERTFLGLNAGAEDLRDGTVEILSEFVRASETGFSESEVERAAAVLVSSISSLSDEQAFDTDLADLYTLDFLLGASLSETSEEVERQLGLLEDITAAEASEHLAWIMASSAPLIIVVSDNPNDTPTRQEMLGALEEAVQVGRTLGGADLVQPEAVDRLIDPPDPVETVSVVEAGGTDRKTTIATYANGARMIVTESQIEQDVVYLDAVGDGGWSTLQPGDGPVFDIVLDAIDRSGLGPHDGPTVLRYLESRQASLVPFIGASNEGYLGWAATDQAEVMFELLYLTAVEPRIDQLALDQAKRLAGDLVRQAEVDPDAALDVAVAKARYPDNPWYQSLPTEEQIDGLRPASALRLFEARFGAVDDLDVFVYGDIDTRTMLELGERWIATLPTRDEPDSAVDVGGPPPEGIVTELLEAGVADGAGAILMQFTAAGEYTSQDQVAINFLRQIIDERLVRELREERSATYGGSVFIDTVPSPPEIISGILVNGDPARIVELRDAILAELDDLATNGPTNEEFERIFGVLDSDYGFIDNNFILDQAMAKARGDEAIDSQYRFRLLDAVTPEMLRAMADRIFPADQRIDIVRLPPDS